jgi:dihydrofolate synthase/folylpolyglutamate synthase
MTTIRDALQRDNTHLQDRLTRFEILTAAAFLYFAGRCDCVVLETGLGGVYDATNIIEHPLLCILTKISYDHMQYLGDTIASIAINKAGIIKPGATVVVAPQEHIEASVVFADAARTLKCRHLPLQHSQIHRRSQQDTEFDYGAFGTLKSGLCGAHQIDNAATAVAAVAALATVFAINERHIRDGLANVIWPCRLQKMQDKPTVYIDGAHNVDGAWRMMEYLQSKYSGRCCRFVFGCLADKNYAELCAIIKPLAFTVYTVTPDSVRALPAETLAAELISQGIPAVAAPSVQEGVLSCIANSADNDVVCIFGSLYMAGAALELLQRTNA